MIERRIAKLTIVLILLLTLLSFALSYDNLRQLAYAHGKLGWRGLLWPVLIDGSLIVFALVVVYQSRRNRSTRLARWLVVSFTAATVYFNVAIYIPIPDALNFVLVAVSAPVVLYFSFETLMDMLKAGDVAIEPAKLIAHKQPETLTALSERLSEIESEPETRVEQPGSEPEPLTCPDCGVSTNAKGEPMTTPQALSAHKRFCAAKRVSTNGKHEPVSEASE